MLTIIQSNKIETLFDQLLKIYQEKADTRSVFEPFNVIVPSKVMGEWLKKQVADQAGISTLVTTEFWGRYFWGLMQKVLRTYKRYRDDVLEVPDVAMLSKSIMQWQIFGLIMTSQTAIAKDESHPLHAFVAPLVLDNQTTQAQKQKNEQSARSSHMAWLSADSMLANDSQNQAAQHQSIEERFWQLAGDMASMLNRYMTYRPEWLVAWGNNEPIAIEQMIADKDAMQNRLHGRRVEDDNSVATPDWLIEHYLSLEHAQRYLWRTLFDADYRYRQALQQQFWQAFDETVNDKTAHHGDAHTQTDKLVAACRRQLPKHLVLFTVQQLPPSELLDLQRMGALTHVTLLHFNPSEQFWADIVDKNWLLEQQIVSPNSIYLKDYGHTLLSCFGKQSREVFAMLANLSGNEYQDEHKKIEWQDKFVSNDSPATLLEHLQQDILMLEESPQTEKKINELLTFVQKSEDNQTPSFMDERLLTMLNGSDSNTAMHSFLDKLKSEYDAQRENTKPWQLPSALDTSLTIQVCHSTARQLEVLRNMLIGWLNYTDNPAAKPANDMARRSPSDVLVLLPDIDAQQNTIEAIFPKGEGADGYTLPAKVTGVVGKDINQLWQAITGYYRLLGHTGARFSRMAVFDWLLLPPLYQSFGLNLEQMNRACELLSLAGFVRGFDEAHLQQTLHEQDDDYRYTFAYALERLVAGVMMPHAPLASFGILTNRYEENEKIEPLAQVSMSDSGIVAVLCQIYQTLHANRDVAQQSQTVEQWLIQIETLIQQRFAVFNQTNAWLAIFAAQNELKNHIHAHQQKNYQPLTAATDTDPSDRPDTYTEALPLKLNFILESIAQQLASQQVSAEPSGVITFARIGAVRNLPYQLVVMLNLNLADFPKREQQNRYNLMQAGLPKRGDRFREDDDLGAFLDGLLCARQACWLFYNGKSTADTHEHLPASPVQELLSFLQNEVTWQPLDDEPNAASQPSNHVAQQLEQYLVTRHPALPFDSQYFELKDAAATELSNNQTKRDKPKQGKSKQAKTKQAKTKHDKTNQPQPQMSLEAVDSVKPTPSLDKDNLSFSNRLLLEKNKLYPAARIWHGLYRQLGDPSASNSVPLERVAILSEPQLRQWLATWQSEQTTFNDSYFNRHHSPTDSAATHQSANLADNLAHNLAEQLAGQISYVHLSLIIKDLQNPARAFINAQQLHVNTQGEQLIELEPLQLESLASYQLKHQLTQQLFDKQGSQIAPQHEPPKQQRTISSYNDHLPAGVNRYQVLDTLQTKVSEDIVSLFDKLQEFEHADTPLERHEQQSIGKRFVQAISRHLATNDADSNPLTHSQKQQVISQLLTDCQEQFVPIHLPSMPNLSNNDNPPLQAQIPMQTLVLTAQLPVANSNGQPPSFWLNYLPFSGRDKYHIQFWLSHLCWQIARRTSEQQAADNDGFSLWQYQKYTLYLPAIVWQQAYSWLQDWLGMWQLATQQVIILPPKVAMTYLAPAKEQGNDTSSSPFSRTLSDWLVSSYRQDNQPIYDSNMAHPHWQLLLGDKNPYVIEPFMLTLGDYLYTPMMAMVKSL